jgi:molybdate transport system substrate-binding protein
VRHAARALASLVLVLVPVLVLAGGCGGGGERVTVLGAASLGDALARIDPDARLSLAGSDALAAQIREGAPADVYASASIGLARDLHEEGLLEEPRVLATNRLVILVPRGNPAGVRSVADLAAPGVDFVMAEAGVPAGDYARAALGALGRSGLADAAASQEDDVRAVALKVALGEADAGLAYATDAAPFADRVEAVPLPSDAMPAIEYGIAVVADSSRRDAAAAYVRRALGPEGRRALADEGFGPP